MALLPPLQRPDKCEESVALRGLQMPDVQPQISWHSRQGEQALARAGRDLESRCRKPDGNLVPLLLLDCSGQRQRLLAERLCDVRERLALRRSLGVCRRGLTCVNTEVCRPAQNYYFSRHNAPHSTSTISQRYSLISDYAVPLITVRQATR